MPRVCTICAHTERTAIDKALVAGEGYRAIAERYGVSLSALHRHGAAHLPKHLAEAQAAADVADADNLLEQMRQLQQITMGILGRSGLAGDNKIALQAIGEARRNLELMGKLLGELDDRPQVNILVTSPEWLAVRSRLLVALEPYLDARMAAAEALDAGR